MSPSEGPSLIIDQPPHSIRARIPDFSGEQDGLRLAAASDIGPDGRFGKRWLVVARDRLYVLSSNGSGPELDSDIPLAELRGPKAEAMVGNGELTVRRNGQPLELLRYSNACSAKFNRVAHWLEAALKEADHYPGDPDLPTHCGQCGRRYPEGTQVCPACMSKARAVFRIFRYARPYRGLLVIAAGLMLASTILALAPPYLTRILVDRVLDQRPGLRPPSGLEALLASGGPRTTLGLVVLSLVITQAANTALQVFRRRLAGILGAAIGRDVRADMFQHLQRLSLGFYDKRQVGQVMSRVQGDSQQLQIFLVDGAQFILVNALQLIAISVALFLMNWRLALLVVIPAPFVLWASAVLWRRLFSMFHRFWQRSQQLSAMLNDSLSGIRVVRAFAQETREVERFGVRNQEVFEGLRGTETAIATTFPILAFLTTSGSFLVWYVGGQQIVGHQGITLGTLMAFLGYLAMFYGPMEVLSRVSDWASRSLSAAERIFEILDSEPEVPEPTEPVALDCIQGRVEFRDVTFGYDRYKPVLKDVNLAVEPGEMIALVGHTGAGKSTTINLICRFYDVNEGAILIDGVDVRKLRSHDIRSQIGIVPQEPFLFSGSIAENIAYSRTDATIEEIMAAACAANCHDFIMRMPDGYDTQVGERGQSLSGGERQRIMIARAILRDPRILILDEATSSVDTETETQIQEALARLVKGRTTFAIAHRLSTLRHADRLVVLDKGCVAEIGTHDELMEKRGPYQRLVEMQTELSRIRAVDG